MNRKICYYLDEVDNILNGKTQYPISCEIDPSNYCQNNCSFCLFAEFRSLHPTNMDYYVFLNLVTELKFLGVKSITFTGGGEPLLNPKFPEMVAKASGLNFDLGLVTNGIALHNIMPLLRLFKFIRISLNAADKKTYRKIHGEDFFNRIISNVREAVSLRLETTAIGLSYVVCDDNKDDVTEAGRLAEELGVDYIQFKPQLGRDDLVDDINSNSISIITPRYKVKHHLPCAIAGLVGIVGADHKVYFCCQHRGREEFELGSLEDGSFSELWKKRRKLEPDLSLCSTCRYMNYAKGYEEFSGKKYTFLRHRNFL